MAGLLWLRAQRCTSASLSTGLQARFSTTTSVLVRSSRAAVRVGSHKAPTRSIGFAPHQPPRPNTKPAPHPVAEREQAITSPWKVFYDSHLEPFAKPTENIWKNADGKLSTGQKVAIGAGVVGVSVFGWQLFEQMEKESNLNGTDTYEINSFGVNFQQPSFVFYVVALCLKLHNLMTFFAILNLVPFH